MITFKGKRTSFHKKRIQKSCYSTHCQTLMLIHLTSKKICVRTVSQILTNNILIIKAYSKFIIS